MTEQTTNPKKHIHTKLNEVYATAISGNDIMSSCLYVAGIASIYAGVLAPVVLLVVGVTLYFFRHVYQEVVEALPINGGAYNCLLNGTSKPVAAIAGVMTILSYIATACISAKVGVEYFATAFSGINVMVVTIGLLGVFAFLVIMGLKDSAKVALFIFAFHVLVLALIIIFGIDHAIQNGIGTFLANLADTKNTLAIRGGILPTLYLAFSASLLGVSGFESSANFVEEQQEGVFRKTLRNMWLGVIIFNPLIALVSLNALPLGQIESAKDFMLAGVGYELGKLIPFGFGPVFLKDLIAIDAILVLSGAVLTAYVGVSGLVSRMALDGVLPSSLSYKNKQESYPITIIAFFLLCTSILLVTKGELLSLAGVYTISFLGVMSLFALGNLILKRERSELKRTYWSPVKYVVIAFLATALGTIGNMIIDPLNLRYFLTYFIPAITIAFAMIYQDYIMAALLYFAENTGFMKSYIRKRYNKVTRLRIVVFIHHVGRLHSILRYIARNETGRDVVLVSCVGKDQEETKNSKAIDEALPHLIAAGVYNHLQIRHDVLQEDFSPEAIKIVAKKYNVPVNRVLTGSIHHHHDFDYPDLGGVRIISA
ncbi:MAG: APC family permease [Patescibacteria group bacterium]